MKKVFTIVILISLLIGCSSKKEQNTITKCSNHINQDNNYIDTILYATDDYLALVTYISNKVYDSEEEASSLFAETEQYKADFVSFEYIQLDNYTIQTKKSFDVSTSVVDIKWKNQILELGFKRDSNDNYYSLSATREYLESNSFICSTN